MKMKAQSISINTIVVAAIALVVLVVIIAIFGNRMWNVNKGMTSCETQGGECAESCAEDETGIDTNIPGTDCERRTDNLIKCCLSALP